MRSMLTVACVAASLAAWTMLAILPSPAAAAPPNAAAPADTTIRSTDEDSIYAFEYLLRHARPVIGIQYGFGDVDRDGFGGNLASVGALDAQLGFRVERRYGGLAARVPLIISYKGVTKPGVSNRLAHTGVDLIPTICDYAGIRVARSGRRFRILRATVWILVDASGRCIGQAAAIPAWEPLT